MEKKLTKTIKNTIALCVVLLIILAGTIYWHNLINNNLDILLENKKTYAEDLVNSKSTEEINKRLILANASEEFFNERYINADKAVDFITYLENLAKDTGVDLGIQSLYSSKEDNSGDSKQGFEKIEMTLNFQGSWGAVDDFILALENLPYHIDIKKINLNSIKSEEDELIWSASLNFVGIAK